MHRLTFYAITSILTFFLGVTAFRATLAINSLEDQWSVYQAPSRALETELTLTDERSDANDVYRAVIREAFVKQGTKLLVIQSRTTGCGFYENEENAAEYRPNYDFVTTVKAFMPEADSATLEDYFTKNKMSEDVLLPDLGIAYRLISPEEMERMFSEHGTGWSDFYERYPESNGLIYFSRVGFNLQRDQAFVYLADSCGGLCGQGSYVLLKKEATGWKIQQKKGLWVS